MDEDLEAARDQNERTRARGIIGIVGALSGAICVTFTIIGLVLDLGIMARFFGAYALVYGVVGLLWKTDHWRSAGWLLFLTIASGVTLLSSLFGRGSLIELTFLLLPVFPYYVVPLRRSWARAAVNLVPVGCIALLILTDYTLLPDLGISPETSAVLRLPLVICNFIAAFTVFEIASQDRSSLILAETELEASRRRAVLDENLRQIQKLESLGVLAGGIAHDFNNLLTGVLGNASLARAELQPGSLEAECVAEIEDSAWAAAELCHQMLAYAGRGQLEVGPLDVSDLVGGTVRLLTMSVRKSARLELDLCADALVVEGDRNQLRQVLMNLVMNASDALRVEGGHIYISTARVEADAALFEGSLLGAELQPGAYAHFEVRDEGQGIAPELLERLFEPFFSTKSAGRGLGLSAVLGIVKAHRGALTVESELGVGTSFHVYLPLGAAPLVVDKKTERPPRSSFTGRVLIVDDEARVRATLRRMLEHLGLEVILASDGELALTEILAPNAELRLVILDSNMPGKSGREVLERVRERLPALSVILASGFDATELRASFGGDPHLRFLQKPFRAEDLTRVIHELLEAPADDAMTPASRLTPKLSPTE